MNQSKLDADIMKLTPSARKRGAKCEMVFVSPSEWLTKWRAHLKPIAKPCNAKPKQSSENRALPVVVLCESMFYVNKHTLAVELLLK